MKQFFNIKSIFAIAGILGFSVALSSCGGANDAYGCPSKITQVTEINQVA